MDIMSYLMGQNSAIKKGMKVEVVTELPETGQENVVYLVPKQSGSTGDLFDEYLYINNAWEHIGSADIDLSNYYTKSEVDALLPPIYVVNSESTGSDQDTLNRIGEIFTDAYAKGFKAISLLYTYKYENKYYQVLLSSHTNSTYVNNIQNKPSTHYFSGLIHGVTSQTADSDTQVNALFFWRVASLTWSGDICTATSFWGSLYTHALPTIRGVLTKTNTTSYTPTANYHPATKKYVDDNKETWYPMILTGSQTDTSNSKISNYTAVANAITAEYAKGKNFVNFIIYYRDNWYSKFYCKLGTDIQTKPTMIGGYFYAFDYGVFKSISIIGTWSGNTFSINYNTTNIFYQYMLANMATQAYVDSAISAAITDALGGSY